MYIRLRFPKCSRVYVSCDKYINITYACVTRIFTRHRIDTCARHTYRSLPTFNARILNAHKKVHRPLNLNRNPPHGGNYFY